MQHEYLARDSNPVLRFRRPPCFHHTRKAKRPPAIAAAKQRTSVEGVPRQGVEPRLAASKTAVLPSHSQGKTVPECPDLESNPDPNLRKIRCAPLHHRDDRPLRNQKTTTVVPHTINNRADDWIRTSMIRFTRAVPFCFEPRRRKSRNALRLRRASSGARIRTPSSGFGDRRLSQEHAAVSAGHRVLAVHTGFGLPTHAAQPKTSCDHLSSIFLKQNAPGTRGTDTRTESDSSLQLRIPVGFTDKARPTVDPHVR